MLKLLKYEFRKTLFTKIAMLAVALIVEGIFLYSLFREKQTGEVVTLVALLFMAIFSIVFMGIQSVATLHRDMNTRQSYMLFMTPNSTYRILGAKVLETGISTLLMAVFFALIAFIDVPLLRSHDQTVDDAVEILKNLLNSMGSGIDISVPEILCLVFYVLCSWVSTVTLLYLADVISSSLLNGKKGGLLISCVIFFALDYAVTKLNGLMPDAASSTTNYLLQGAFCLVVSAITYVGTAKMMDKYLSV